MESGFQNNGFGYTGSRRRESFASSYSSKKTTISGADFVSAKRNEDGNLGVKVNYYPVVQLGQTGESRLE